MKSSPIRVLYTCETLAYILATCSSNSLSLSLLVQIIFSEKE